MQYLAAFQESKIEELVCDADHCLGLLGCMAGVTYSTSEHVY